MKVFFLAAGVPLTKSFSLNSDGTIEKSPYPLVKKFTSFQEEVDTIDDFYAAINKHAAYGRCLLKGQLNRVLLDESRAGAANPATATEWLCFDLDNIKSIDTVARFVNEVLPPEFNDVSYILQYSASAGVSGDTGLRAHVFYLLNKTAAPDMLKLFVTSLNLKNPLLTSQLALTVTGTSLRYPLDRSVNQNDKLIYIAPPSLQLGMVDSLAGQRIKVVHGTRERVTIDWSKVETPPQVEQAIAAKVDALREVAGLEKKRGKFKSLQTGETLLSNPDIGIVTGERQGRGFVYLNMNGGDSWAYYYPEDNPQYLYNFKGEPVVELKAVAPTYWAQLQNNLQQDPNKDDRKQPFVFRRHETDTLYAGVWNDVDKKFAVIPAQIKRESLEDFFGVYGTEVPSPIEDWRYEFDPTNKNTFDPIGKFCNQFEATALLSAEPKESALPATIDRVIHSVVGDDSECYHHFINWLACIYQTRKKTMTAWVFHGVEGTGKGVLYSKVLAPIFGHRYCAMKQISSFEDAFNADLEHALLICVDEARIEDSTRAKRTLNRIKNMITEERQDIRGMRANAVQVRNFTNLIFTSNDYDSLSISQTDRRFNIAPRQENPLKLTGEDIDQIAKELPAFASFLAGYAIDMQKAHTALNNDAKMALRAASQDSVEQFFQAVVDGDLEYFIEAIESGTPAPNRLIAFAAYQNTMREWLRSIGTKHVVSSAQLYAAYEYLIAPSSLPGPKKFCRLMAHKNIPPAVKYCPMQKKAVRGVMCDWKATPEQLEMWRHILLPSERQPQSDDAKVTPWKQLNSA